MNVNVWADCKGLDSTGRRLLRTAATKSKRRSTNMMPAMAIGRGLSAPRSYSHLDLEATDGSLPLCSERSRIIASRIQFSRQWAWLYAGAIVVNGLLLIWTVLEATTRIGHSLWPSTKRAIFVSADATVTMLVLTEIGLNWMTQGRSTFCGNWTNYLDLCVALLCLGALGMAVTSPTAELEEEEEAEAVVLLLRYAAQLLRLGMLVGHYRRQAGKKQLDVELGLNLHLDGPSDRLSVFSEEGLPSPQMSHPHPRLSWVAGPHKAKLHPRLDAQRASQQPWANSTHHAQPRHWWALKYATPSPHSPLAPIPSEAGTSGDDSTILSNGSGVFAPVTLDPPLRGIDGVDEGGDISPHHPHPPAQSELGDHHT